MQPGSEPSIWRRAAHCAQRHPFLTAFVILGVWLTALTYGGYRLNKADQDRGRQVRASAIATANQQVCKAVNTKVLQPLRRIEHEQATGSAKQAATLLLALGFTKAQVAAYNKAAAKANAATLAKIDKRFGDIDCAALATNSKEFVTKLPDAKPLPHVTTTVATTPTQ